jgi:hypothetical protein
VVIKTLNERYGNIPRWSAQDRTGEDPLDYARKNYSALSRDLIRFFDPPLVDALVESGDIEQIPISLRGRSKKEENVGDAPIAVPVPPYLARREAEIEKLECLILKNYVESNFYVKSNVLRVMELDPETGGLSNAELGRICDLNSIPKTKVKYSLAKLAGKRVSDFYRDVADSYDAIEDFCEYTGSEFDVKLNEIARQWKSRNSESSIFHNIPESIQKKLACKLADYSLKGTVNMKTVQELVNLFYEDTTSGNREETYNKEEHSKK